MALLQLPGVHRDSPPSSVLTLLQPAATACVLITAPVPLCSAGTCLTFPSPLNAGKGAVYSFDAVGSHERVGYGCDVSVIFQFSPALLDCEIVQASFTLPTIPLVTLQGSGKSLIQPVLDNQLKAASPLVLPQRNWMTALPQDEALDLIKDAFVAAGERDIYTVSHCLRCSSSLTGLS